MNKEELRERRRQIHAKMKKNGVRNNDLRLKGKPYDMNLLNENQELAKELSDINVQLYRLGERTGFIL